MGYRLRQTLVGTRKRKTPAFLVFQSLKDARLNGFSEVTTLSSLPSLLLLLWQEPGRTEGEQLFGRDCLLHGVFLLFTRVGRWQVRTPEREGPAHLPAISASFVKRLAYCAHRWAPVC